MCCCRDLFQRPHDILLEIIHLGPRINVLRFARFLRSVILAVIGLTRRVLFNQVQCNIQFINLNNSLRNFRDDSVKIDN
jgi:hypothetical protein